MDIYFALCVLIHVYSVWLLRSFQLWPRQVPRLTCSERGNKGAVWWLQMTSGEPVDLGRQREEKRMFWCGRVRPGGEAAVSRAAGLG